MTTPEFIINTMKEMDCKYFTIHDTSHRLVYHQWQNIGIEESVRRFQNFVDNAATNSMFEVSIYHSNLRLKNGDAKEEGMTFELMITEKQKAQNDRMGGYGNDPLSNIQGLADNMYSAGSKGAIDLTTYLASKDEIMVLRMEIQQLKMENRYIQDKCNGDIERIRREYEERLSSDKKIEGVIGAVLPHIGLGANALGLSGINGIGTQIEQEVMTTKDKVISSVNVLIKVDPNFAENIEKLAKLAQDKPMIYKAAVQQLNSL
jgi:hypothetical protein